MSTRRDGRGASAGGNSLANPARAQAELDQLTQLKYRVLLAGEGSQSRVERRLGICGTVGRVSRPASGIKRL